MTTTRILLIALPVWLAAAGILLYLLFRPAMRVATGRGEVAEAPETCACGRRDLSGRPLPDPDPFDQEATRPPLHRPVRVVSREYPTTPVERRFAKDIENWMKEQVR